MSSAQRASLPQKYHTLKLMQDQETLLVDFPQSNNRFINSYDLAFNSLLSFSEKVKSRRLFCVVYPANLLPAVIIPLCLFAFIYFPSIVSLWKDTELITRSPQTIRMVLFPHPFFPELRGGQLFSEQQNFHCEWGRGVNENLLNLS